MGVKQVKLHSHSLQTLLHLSQRLYGGLRGLTNTQRYQTSLPDYKEAHMKLLTLQDSLQRIVEGTTLGTGVAAPGPLRDFLLMERERLADNVAFLLASLSSPSSKTASSYTEYTVQALSKLEKRVNLLQDYLGEDSSSSTFSVCCLSAFENPQGFLGALIRQTAQDKQRDVSEVYLQYRVQNIFSHKWLCFSPSIIKHVAKNYSENVVGLSQNSRRYDNILFLCLSFSRC